MRPSKQRSAIRPRIERIKGTDDDTTMPLFLVYSSAIMACALDVLHARAEDDESTFTECAERVRRVLRWGLRRWGPDVTKIIIIQSLAAHGELETQTGITGADSFFTTMMVHAVRSIYD